MRKVILEKAVGERLLEEMLYRTKLTDEKVSYMKKNSRQQEQPIQRS